MDTKYALFFIYIDEIKKFLYQLGLDNVFGLYFGLTVVLIFIFVYFFELRPPAQKKKIEERAAVEYHRMHIHEGVTSDYMNAYWSYMEPKREAKYVERVKSRYFLYANRNLIGFILAIIGLWLTKWWFDFCSERDYSRWITLGVFFIVLMGGLFFFGGKYETWKEKVEKRAKEQFGKINGDKDGNKEGFSNVVSNDEQSKDDNTILC